VSRRLTRALTTTGLLAVAVTAAGCTTEKEPGQNYPSLGSGMTILLFVILPLAIFGTIGLLAALPSLLKRPRYRPGRAWDHDPLWFAGPDDAEAAIARTRVSGEPKGGASAEW
jgi:hypothetical protein